MVHYDSRDEAYRDEDDDCAQIRFSLTALGEAHLEQARGPAFDGFGPCRPAAWPAGIDGSDAPLFV